MRERGRHPFFENLVYGLALALALIIVFYGMRSALKEKSAGTAHAPPPPPKAAAAAKNTLVPSGTERSVSELPPMQLSRTGTLKRRAPAVPPPARRKD